MIHTRIHCATSMVILPPTHKLPPTLAQYKTSSFPVLRRLTLLLKPPHPASLPVPLLPHPLPVFSSIIPTPLCLPVYQAFRRRCLIQFSTPYLLQVRHVCILAHDSILTFTVFSRIQPPCHSRQRTQRTSSINRSRCPWFAPRKGRL